MSSRPAYPQSPVGHGPLSGGAGGPPRRKRIHGPQGVVLVFCIWLIGSWIVTLGFESAIVASQLMMPYAVLGGLTLFWPMLRLSQWRGVRSLSDKVLLPGDSNASGRPFAETVAGPDLTTLGVLREWLCLNLVAQAVVWPLMINARWSVLQTLWLDGLLASWSLVVAAMIRCGGYLGTGWGRSVAMVICLLLVYGEPVIMGLLNMFAGTGGYELTWQMRISPIQAVWRVTQVRGGHLNHQDTAQVVSAGLAAIAAWLGLAVLHLTPIRAPRDYRDLPDGE